MKSLKSTVLTVAAGVLAMSAVAAGHVASADPATPTWSCEAELDAVRGVPQQIIDAWAANDGAAVAAVFAPDGNLVVGDGTHLVGRREITTYMTDAFETFLDGTNVTAPVKDARCIAPTVGVVHTLGGILLPGETEVPPEREGIQTFVVTKDTDGGPDVGWLIAAYQNTRIDQQP